LNIEKHTEGRIYREVEIGENQERRSGAAKEKTIREIKKKTGQLGWKKIRINEEAAKNDRGVPATAVRGGRYFYEEIP